MKKTLLFTLFVFGFLVSASAHITEESAAKSIDSTALKTRSKSRLQLGGYGEVVFSRNFFSSNPARYTDAMSFANDKGHGRFDIPHVVLWLGYDFGRGWSLGTEVEFEHGGVGSAVEMEVDEGGEYETEVEKGGEVVLEQFWINKAWLAGKVNLKVGHIIVPVGATNMYHMPTEFFTNMRPEGERTIMPCTWHQTGVSLWGKTTDWRYELLFLPGLDSDRFNSQNWIGGAAGSPYEFEIANSYAGAFRVDNFSVKGLRLSLSGYIGNSFKNTLSSTEGAKYKGVKGTVLLGAFDFCYNSHNIIVRGNFDYGHLYDSELITSYNMTMRKDSPSPKQHIGSDALAGGLEFGYDFFSLNKKLHSEGQSFHLFARYEYYDSMFRTQGSVIDSEWCAQHRWVVGLNYRPMRDIVVKAEYGQGILAKQYNKEPYVSVGIAYAGLFNNYFNDAKWAAKQTERKAARASRKAKRL